MNTKEGILEKRIGDFAQREFYTNKHFIEELVSAKEAFLSPKKKYKFRRPLSKSFKFAYQGLEFAFCTQPNLRIHILTGALVIVCGLIVRLSGFEMAILSLIITSVIVAELINTAVETSLDWINGNKYNPLVKVIKDVTAAAVLLTSINAVIVGSIIFIRQIIRLV